MVELLGLALRWSAMATALRGRQTGHDRDFEERQGASITVWNNLARAARFILVSLTAIFLMAGVAACTQTDAPPPPPSSPSSKDLVMPNLIGKYWPDAEPELRRAGWVGFVIKAPDVPVEPQNRNRVMRQLPSVGEHIKSDDPITLQFGI
jgi:hypothetical protein